MTDICHECNGKGCIDIGHDMLECGTCHGIGVVGRTDVLTCPRCDGTTFSDIWLPGGGYVQCMCTRCHVIINIEGTVDNVAVVDLQEEIGREVD